MARDKDLEQEIADIATATERLRVHYQAFFLGMEKQPPIILRDQLERKIRESVLNDVTQAFFKFRFQAAVSRYRTMAVYWDRIMRDLESGRTTRAKLRADKGYGQSTGPIAEIETPRLRRMREAQARAEAEAAAKNGAAPTGQPALPPDLPPLPEQPAQTDSGRRLFDEFVEARKACNLPVEGLTPEAFKKTLDKQREVHTANPEVRDVQFSIKVKEGRVVVVARPIK